MFFGFAKLPFDLKIGVLLLWEKLLLFFAMGDGLRRNLGLLKEKGEPGFFKPINLGSEFKSPSILIWFFILGFFGVDFFRPP